MAVSKQKKCKKLCSCCPLEHKKALVPLLDQLFDLQFNRFEFPVLLAVWIPKFS